ncbi:ABC transporter permease subunit, partial [Escherichia coli]|uniref:ABC transporter permease subunit n=1 Tax=Escherichia coli TaxID=562 RepID=UPI0013D6B2FE
HWPAIGASFLTTVEMAALTILIGIPLGLLLAVLRLYGIRPLNWLIIFYIDFFRSIPQLVIIVLVFFA